MSQVVDEADLSIATHSTKLNHREPSNLEIRFTNRPKWYIVSNMNMLKRDIEAICRKDLETFPIVTLTGPRQSGKSTLLRLMVPEWRYVNLEDPSQLDFASEDPKGFLNTFSDRVLIDEVQRVPQLLSYLQVEVDRERRPGRFVLSGSNNLLLLESVSQSLAGRTSIRNLLPFSYQELAAHQQAFSTVEDAIFYGSYPPVVNYPTGAVSWLDSYIQTYLERDVRLIRNVNDLGQFRRFLKMCAGRAAQILDLSSIGRDTGVTHNTIRDWIGILETGFIAFRLQPYHLNFSKRLIKNPKLYFYDTGVLCRLLGIASPHDLHISPFRGALFENWCVVECLKSLYNRGNTANIYFWKDKAAEVDIVLEHASRKIVTYECKSSLTLPTADALRGAKYLKKIMAEFDVTGRAVYAGSETQQRTDGDVLGWASFAGAI
jgi:predicted AAA+ superfamily ATPase